MEIVKNKKKLPETQIHFLRHLIHEKEADERILNWVGLIALENKEWKMAEEIFACLLERRDKVTDLVGLGKALQNLGHFKEAEECLLEASYKIKEPCMMLYTVHKALGDLFTVQEDYPMAEEHYNKAGAITPKSSNLLFCRAMMYLKEKNYRLAEKRFKAYLKDNLDSIQAWLGLAISRKALGEVELGEACLKKCLDLEPKNTQALKLHQKWQEEKLPDTKEKEFAFAA